MMLFMEVLPLLSERTGMVTSTLAFFAAAPGLFAKSAGTSIVPLTIWLSTVQSCTVEVPSTFILLPGRLSKRIASAAYTAKAANSATAVPGLRKRIDFIDVVFDGRDLP